MTSSFLALGFKGNIFGRVIYTPSAIVIVLIVPELWRRGLNPTPAPLSPSPHRPGLESVKIIDHSECM